MTVKNIAIKDFTYLLPTHQIAAQPTQKRTDSKLLYYNEGVISHKNFIDIPSIINENTNLIFNNSKVIPARFIFEKENGGKIEIFFLEPLLVKGDYAQAMAKKQTATWKCLVGGLSKWKEGPLSCSITINNEKIVCKAFYKKIIEDAHEILLEWEPSYLTMADIFLALGNIPLPPYMQREANEIDVERYQTIYAQHKGSVAAPTAGLHFDETILQDLKDKNINISYTTLHVGAGTFKPVKTATMESHPMHEEWLVMDMKFLNNWKNNIHKNNIAVGTTSLRALETIYWLGVKLHHHLIVDNHFYIDQWEVYDEKLLNKKISVEKSLEAIINFFEKNNIEELYASTSILIAPGYKINTIQGLITNFHQPESTLLLLVAALIGDNWKNIYTTALEHNYRFLSYGDSSLLMV